MPGEIIAEGEVRVGINLAAFDAELRTLTGDVDRAMAELSRKKATVTVDMDIAPLEREADTIDKQLATLDRTVVKPRADLDTKLFDTKLAAANKQLDAFGARTATAHLAVDIGAASASIAAITAEIAALRAAAEAPINLNVNSSTAGAAGAGAAQGAAASAGGASGGGAAGSGLLGAALLGHAGGGGRRLPGWAGWALGGAAGLGAGVGSVGSFAGLGAEHIILTLGGIAGSGAAALGGAGLLGAGAAGSMAVGGGADLAVMKSTAADAKQLGEAYSTVAEDVAVYGRNSETTEHAVAKLHYLMKQLGGARSAGVREEIKLFKEAEGVNKLWDQKTQRDRVFASRILEQGVSLGHHFVPKVAQAAEQNLPLVNMGLKPLTNFLEGKEGTRIFDTLEGEFKKNLPTSLHAFDQAMQFVLKTVAAASKYTGGFVHTLDELFTKWNSPAGFKSWEGEIHSLIETFHVWAAFFKTLGRDIFDLFSQDEHTGKAIIETLTGMLAKVGEWERSTAGKEQIHNIFAVHKEEVLALLKILPPLVTSFKDIYTTIAPPMVEAVTDVLNVVAKLLVAFEKTGPLARWALGITLILAKLRLLVPLLKTVGILSAGDAVAGAGAAAVTGVGAIGAARAAAASGLSAVGAETASSAMLSGGTGAALGTVGGSAAGLMLPATLLVGGVIIGDKVHKVLKEHGIDTGGSGSNVPRGPTGGGDILESFEGAMEGFERSQNTEIFGGFTNSIGLAMRKGIHTMKGEWILGMHSLKTTLEETLHEIGTDGSWRSESARAMRTFIKTIEKGMEAGVIPAKQGEKEINRILGQIHLLNAGKGGKGTDPFELAEAMTKSMKKAGGVTEAGVENLISKLSIMTPQARGQVEHMILGMMHAWAQGHPKLEKQVEGLSDMFEFTFSKMNRKIIKGAGGFQEALGKTYGKLLTGVSFDLSGILEATQGALSNLGVGNVIANSLKFSEAHGNFGGVGANEKKHSGRHATGARVDRPTFFAGEEAPQHPEWVIASNPAYKNANLGYWAEAGHALGVPGFKGGGIPFPSVSGPSQIAGVGNLAIGDVHQAAVNYLKKLTPTGGGGIGVAGNVPTGPIQKMAHEMVRRIWGQNQWSPFVSLEMSEAGWNPHAQNPESPAYGLAQADPPSKMPRGGQPGSSLPILQQAKIQLQWMMSYIKERYNDPASAWAYHLAHNSYKGGGKVGSSASSEAARAVGFARSNKGSGPMWGDPPGGWCGEFMAADMEAAGLNPPGGFALAANWASYGEPRTIADAGDVVVYGGSGHVGLAVGGGALISGDWGGVVGKSAVHGGGYPGPIVAIRRPPYKETGSTGTSGGSSSAPTLSPAQKEARKIAHFEKKHPPGSTGAGGGTMAPGATKHEIATSFAPPSLKGKLPPWATELPKTLQEELEGRAEGTEGRRNVLSLAQQLTAGALGRDESTLSRAKTIAARHHEYNTPAEKAARSKIAEDKFKQQQSSKAVIGFDRGIVKFTTREIKKINAELKSGKLSIPQKKQRIARRTTLEVTRNAARGDIEGNLETIANDEFYGEEVAIEEEEENEAAGAAAKEAAEGAEAASKEAAAVFSEDITSLNSARYALLAGNASNILNLGTGGSLMPGHTSSASGNIFQRLGGPPSGGHAWEYAPQQEPVPGSTVNQYLTINTPQVDPHHVAAELAWRAKVS